MDSLNQECSPASPKPGMIERLSVEFGLPLHVVFTGRIQRNVESFSEAALRNYRNTLISFAVKSNPCRGAVKLASNLGLGLDVVSEFELQAGLEEGVDAVKIICNGNAKSDRYFDMAVQAGALIAVDSDWELDLINITAKEQNRITPVLLRFAGMPLEGLTDADQSTASAWTKFGFPISETMKAVELAESAVNVDLVGLSAHIGTQVCDEKGYNLLMEYLLDIAKKMQDRGSAAADYIDIGGGFPVSYMEYEEWVDFQAKLFSQLNGNLPTDQWVTWGNIPMGYKKNDSGFRIRDSGIKNQESTITNHDWIGKAYWSDFPGAKMFERLLQGKLSSGKTVADSLRELGNPTLIIEPGRALFGTAGITVVKVSGVKRVQGNHVVALDMGVVNHGHNLISPDIFPCEVYPPHEDDRPIEAFLAGRLCFTGDMISKVKIKLNRMPVRGELMLIHHTGAYAADHFASNCCGFPRPAKVAVRQDGTVEVWRKGEEFEDVFQNL